jgi:tetratricopeptide (TPR) repeat protein
MRMETAARLLRDTGLTVGRIGQLVGYADSSTFSKAFLRWYGLRAGEFRERVRKAEGEVPRDVFDPLESRLSRRLARGQLDPDSRLGLVAYLRPRGQEDRETDHPFEQAVAEEFWLLLRNRPFEEQRKAIGALRFPSLNFFRLLGRKVIEESRDDRQRGIEVAELALAWLELLPEHLESSRSSLEALALAWLGNAHRLAEDFDGAERCFQRAKRLRRAEPEPDPRSEAEILALEGTFRGFRRQLEEGHQLLTRAILLARSLGFEELLARCLLQRSNLYGTRGDFRTMLSDLRAAELLVERLGDSHLALQIHQTIAVGLTFAGEWQAAERQLATTRALCKQPGHTLVYHQLDAIEGLILQGMGELGQAAEAFERARSGMIELGSRGYAAMVSLELAVLRFQQGQHTKAAELASEALPLFTSLSIDREARASILLLRDSLIADHVSEELLIAARDQVRRLAFDPTGPLSKT